MSLMSHLAWNFFIKPRNAYIRLSNLHHFVCDIIVCNASILTCRDLPLIQLYFLLHENIQSMYAFQ